MDELAKQVKKLNQQVADAFARLDVDSQQTELNKLRASSERPDFWQQPEKAQAVMKQIARLDERIAPWLKLRQKLQEITEMLNLNDSSLRTELSEQLTSIEVDLNQLKDNLKLSGPYDDHDAIISLHAGAGGTDAQDWTQMLFRMYSRYFEKKHWKISVLEESLGEEAGLKSATFEVSGNYAYGRLKGEHGVHRLVRLSPFNADHLRQTSFAKVEVMPKIEPSDELNIDEKDLKIDVFRSGGHGGQSVNTTDSAVRITHSPTGISVAIQNERSQLQNKETAMTILRSRLMQLQLEQHKEKLDELKGPNQSAEWGNQIRSYVLHPYKQVKDLRSNFESTDPDAILDGELEPMINAYLEHKLSAPNS